MQDGVVDDRDPARPAQRDIAARVIRGEGDGARAAGGPSDGNACRQLVALDVDHGHLVHVAQGGIEVVVRLAVGADDVALLLHQFPLAAVLDVLRPCDLNGGEAERHGLWNRDVHLGRSTARQGMHHDGRQRTILIEMDFEILNLAADPLVGRRPWLVLIVIGEPLAGQYQLEPSGGPVQPHRRDSRRRPDPLRRRGGRRG